MTYCRQLPPLLFLGLLSATCGAEQGGRVEIVLPPLQLFIDVQLVCRESVANRARATNPRSVLLDYPTYLRPELLRSLVGELRSGDARAGYLSENAPGVLPMLILLGMSGEEVAEHVNDVLDRFIAGREDTLAEARSARIVTRPRAGLRTLDVNLIVGNEDLRVVETARGESGYSFSRSRLDFDRALRLAVQRGDQRRIAQIVRLAALFGAADDLIPVLDEYQGRGNLDGAYRLVAAFLFDTFLNSPHDHQRGRPHLLDAAIEAWGRVRHSDAGRSSLRQLELWLARPATRAQLVRVWTNDGVLDEPRAQARWYGARLTALHHCGEWRSLDLVDSVRRELSTRIGDDEVLRRAIGDVIAEARRADPAVLRHCLEEVRRAERALRATRSPTAVGVARADENANLRYLQHLLETEEVALYGYRGATPDQLVYGARRLLAAGDYPNATRLFIGATRTPPVMTATATLRAP